MGLNLTYIGGQTPLDDEELEELLIPTVTTRDELDEFEQQNIESAMQWTLSNRFAAEEILSEEFLRKLHAEMYGKVWSWAGEFRRTNKNIGVDKFQIPLQLRGLLEDCRYWIVHDTFTADEIAVRFKHRLVYIHCFPNGNGRHSRLAADILVSHVFDRPVFTWGRSALQQSNDSRSAYISALHAADQGDLAPLIRFARS